MKTPPKNPPVPEAEASTQHADTESTAERRGWTRRGFLQTTAGLSALAVTAGQAAKSEPTSQSGPTLAKLGPAEVPLAFEVNGESVKTHAEPRETLADVLLFRLGLTGTKIGCDRGACGACTVLVDDLAHVACLTPALDVANRRVTTVEGLKHKDGSLSALQQAFVAQDALQCGYCTPGFLMAATALYSKTPRPSKEQVVDAVSGNLCRCAAHNHIVDAILSVRDGEMP